MSKVHQSPSKTSSPNIGAKVLSQPLFKLVAVETTLDPDPQEDKFERIPIRTIPLRKGIDRKTAKKCCDIVQEEYDLNCSPVRVYVHIGNDRVPIYAGFGIKQE